MSNDATKTVWRALRAPANLLVAAGAAGGAALFHSLGMLALGGLTYAALVAHDLLHEPGSRRGAQPAQQPPEDLRDAETRGAAEQVARALDEVQRALAGFPGTLAGDALTTGRSVHELRGHAYLLLKRAEALSRFLAQVDVCSERASSEQLAARAEGSRDALARERYRQAATTARERLSDLDEIATARERVLAHVTQIASTLSGVAVKLIRMGALDQQAQDALRGDVERELDTVTREVKIFEDTLELLGEAG